MQTRPALSFLKKSKRWFPPTLLEIYHSTVGVITAAAAATAALFPTVESHTTMACPSMILIANGTVATSVGDEFW